MWNMSIEYCKRCETEKFYTQNEISYVVQKYSINKNI